MVCGASYPGGQSASSLALCSMIARMVSSVSAAPPLDREAVGLLGLAPGLEELAILEPAEGGADRLEETADRADDPHIRTA